ncbi:hypothetical protein [Nonomuraea sp. NPDC046570]
MRMIKRMWVLATVAAVPMFMVMTGTAEAIRIANHCEPSPDGD